MLERQRDSDIIKIRAHHLLCMQGFVGYGYSQEFIDNMKGFIENIKTEPRLEVEIIEGSDIICSCCPHNDRGMCQKETDSDEKVKSIDRRVLEKGGLRKGAIIKAEDIFYVVNKKFKGVSDTEGICSNCGWQKKCIWFSSRGK